MQVKLLFLVIIASTLQFCSCSKVPQNPTKVDDAKGITPLPPVTDEETNPSTVPLKNMMGINGFEWDLTRDNSTEIDEHKLEMVKTFTGFRHYLDWDRIEPQEGKFNMVYYDKIYKRTSENGVSPLICLQIIPGWMRKSYPEYNPADAFGSLRDYTPVLNGSDKKLPASYVAMARAGFQLAARYGKNKNIDQNLLSYPHYDKPTAGLGTVDYIECSNEPDKDWRGPKAQQTPEEYAAQLSAFYDGHMGTLGNNAGVKTADPQMKVVMAGLAGAKHDFVQRMIDWCKTNRVKNGKYTLCFDVINYHEYSNNNWKSGQAPELSNIGELASKFVKMSKENSNIPVWVTECGFDINQKSPQHAFPIGTKTVYDTQADWTLRTSLLYARRGIERVFFYMLNDVNIDDPIQYSSTGLLENGKRRTSAEYLMQVRNLMGDYKYQKTISSNPIVDVYTSSNNKKIYVLTVPDEKGRTADYTLDLGTTAKQVSIYNPKAGVLTMTPKDVAIDNTGKLAVKVTETPTFIKIN